MRGREAPSDGDKKGRLSRRALLGLSVASLYEVLASPYQADSFLGGPKEQPSASELPMLNGEMSHALEQSNSPEDLARNATFLLLDLFRKNGGFDLQSERCYGEHCGAREYKVPPAKIYDRDPSLRNTQSMTVYDLSYNPANGQLHLYVTHYAHERANVPRPPSSRPNVQAATNSFDDGERISNKTHATLEAHFDPPEGVLKADGTIDLAEIAQAINDGHPVGEVYGSYMSPVADMKFAVAYDHSRDEWTQSVQDQRVGDGPRYYRSSDPEVDAVVQKDVPLWLGAVLDVVERDVKLASPIQHA